MSYLPSSSLYLNDPEPQPVQPEPYPEPRHGQVPDAHLEPLRLGQGPAPAAPSAPPPHMYVTAPSIPHTVERIFDQPPPMLPRMPATGPMSAAMTPPHGVERVTERHVDRHHEPPHVVEHVTERVIERPNEAPQVVERIVERYVEETPEPVQSHAVERVVERPDRAHHTVERTVERYVEEAPEPVQPHVVEHVVERPDRAHHTVERTVERYVEQSPEPVQPQVTERIVERIVERQPEPPPQVVERIIERVVDRQPPAPVLDVTPPAPTPAPVLSSSATPIHAVKGPKDWLVASPPAFLVEEHVEPRRIHIEEPELQPEPIPEPRPEPRLEPRHEVRHEPKHEPRHEPRHEPKPVHAVRPEPVTRPAPKEKRHLLHRAHRMVKRHLSRDKSLPPDPGDKELVLMAAWALGACCVALMIWGAINSLPRPGYNGGLRADATSRNLNVVNREYGPGHFEPARPPRFETPPVLTGVQMHLPPPPVDLPRRIVEPPPVHNPRPEFVPPTIPVPGLERTLDALPRHVDPAVFVKANLGDTPMIRTWDNLAKYSMMLTALAVVPTMPNIPQVAAVQPGPVPVPAVDYSKQIEQLTQAVNRLTGDVNKLKDIDDKLEAMRNDVSKQIAKIKVEPHDDSEIKLQLASIQKTLKFLLENPQAVPAAPGVAAAPSPVNSARLDEIKSELGSIKDAILKLRPNDRVALSPPDLPAPAIPAKTARIVFVNLYDKDLFLWVNDKKHPVSAQKTITVEGVTPGTATIEVKSQDAVYHTVRPNLVANETYTLTAR